VPFDVAFIQPKGEFVDVPGKVLCAHRPNSRSTMACKLRRSSSRPSIG
jgi:hypothetical protein